MGEMMKRIVIVAHGLAVGGAERAASILANYMANHVGEVMYICAYRNEREYYIEPHIDIVDIQTNRENRVLRLIERNIKICDHVKKFRADIVISFLQNELVLTELSGIPVVFSLRNDPDGRDGRGINGFVRNFAYHRSLGVVFQTQGARDYFDDMIRSKSTVIVNALNSDKLPYWRNKRHNKSFVTACRLIEEKNLIMLFHAFSIFHQKFPEYILEVYGEGELENSLRQLIVKLKAENFIYLKGRSDQIHEILSESYAFVLSSDHEGLSNSMLEALCIGIPCVCTDCPPGGARSVIEHGVNGILSPVGDAQIFASNMQVLVENPELGVSFAAHADEMREKLDAKKVCGMWIDFIEERLRGC